jgi:predicted GH43/DUF377 family glycosyl hydrolase
MPKSTTNIDITGTTTLDMSMRKAISILFSGTAETGGSATFTIYVSNDGINFVEYNRLITNVANTNGQDDLKTSSFTIDATTTKLLALFPAGDYFRYIKVQMDISGIVGTAILVNGGSGYQVNDVLTLDGYIAYFNGGPDGSHYKIGRAYSLDKATWVEDFNNPILSPTATWEGTIVKDPWPVMVDGVLYLYYAGWRSSTNRFQIGLATSTDYGKTFTKYSGNPIIANGSAGSVDERRAIFPVVLYDTDEQNPLKKWKMWYAGRDGLDVETLAYAYSADGINWTKYGRVLDVGTAGQWDDTILQTGDVKKINGTYYLFYSGATVSGGTNKFSSGVATFTNPESTYTRMGENLVGLTAKRQDLTADTLTGSAIVAVADSSVFQANEYVLIADTNSSPLLTQIDSIDSPTQVTLTDAVTSDITTANSGALRSVFSWSAAIRSIFREDDRWVAFVTFYQVFGDMGYLKELNGFAYNTGDIPTGPWTIDVSRGIALGFGVWDSSSAENFGLVPLQFSEQLRGNADATVTVSSVDANGKITGITLTTLGTGYTPGIYDTLIGNGFGATVEISSDDMGTFGASLEASD